VDSPEGIKVLSINLFHENEDDPVVWRGPMLGKALEQFWADTEWGSLDWLVVDFPPGTSDVALTAFQTIPFSGVVVVGTPQDYVSMIVSKAVKMAGMLEAPVLGMVETMRTMVCPHCGKSVDLFSDGRNGGARAMGLPLLGGLSWRPEIVRSSALSWAGLPADLRREAEGIACAMELALAAVPAPVPVADDACGAGCECGSQACCSVAPRLPRETEGCPAPPPPPLEGRLRPPVHEAGGRAHDRTGRDPPGRGRGRGAEAGRLGSLYQEAAARSMGVSRQTFGRIIETARGAKSPTRF
jgi:hypothetical protein